MTGPAPKRKLSYAEYARWEETSDLKHQYQDGEVFAMAGGTPEHAALAANVTTAIGAQLSRPRCQVFSSDLRVKVPATGLGTYPDVTVVCGSLARDPEDRNSITNPVVLVEVLSDGTEAYDRGDKFEQYRSLASLREYVLVSHRKPLIERHVRNDDGSWTMTAARAGERAFLVSIDCALDVDAIYGSLLSAAV